MTLPVRQATREPAARPTSLWRALDEDFERLFDFRSLLGDVFTPLADIEETDDAYVVEIELPGVAKDDVSVELSGRRLVVSGERKERERVGILRKRTRSVGRFYYEVFLPAAVDGEHVEASLDDGVLTVQVAKPATARRRRIPIS